MAGNGKRRPSMNDVARAAGVSQTTVSLVLNDPENSGIPQATQERVLDAVKTVGYRTNRLARAMRLSRTDTLGFVADDIATSPYANRMIKGAQDAAWEAGRLLLIVNTGALDRPDHGSRERAAVEQLLERQVDGIVLAAMFHRVIDPPPALAEVRSVLLDARAEDDSMSSVVPDEYEAAHTATRYLLDHGHTRIAHMTTNYPSAAPKLRLAGYRDALLQRGVTPDPKLEVTGISNTPGGREMMERLLRLSTPPTAVFCYNDQAAMGAYQAAAAHGIGIPDDLSIVGFDDQELIAADVVPGLSTMKLPHHEMGRWAVDRLLDESDEPTHARMRCELIERDSVARVTDASSS
ncbi:MAG: LacI family DNA-binding transcriptional regulator [Actinomycetota bacterium]